MEFDIDYVLAAITQPHELTLKKMDGDKFSSEIHRLSYLNIDNVGEDFVKLLTQACDSSMLKKMA